MDRKRSSCLEQIGDHEYRCINSEKVYKILLFPFRCPCRRNVKPVDHAKKREGNQQLAEEAYKKLGIIKKTAHYTKALIKWSLFKLAGGKDNSPEETARRTAKCQTCDMFDIKTGCCSICGCPVNANGLPIKNKAAMGSEDCPHPKENKWKN